MTGVNFRRVGRGTGGGRLEEHIDRGGNVAVILEILSEKNLRNEEARVVESECEGRHEGVPRDRSEFRALHNFLG